jgi:biopolymer transport protein ExbB
MSGLLERGGTVSELLLLLSVATVAVLLERVLFWVRESRCEPARALDEARARFGRQPLDEAEVERLLDLEERRLARGLTWLDTIVTAAPMLGILGTVIGIISSFDALSGDASGDPLAVSGGIGQALISTALGLGVALVALFPYNLLRSLVARRIAKLELAWRRAAESE